MANLGTDISCVADIGPNLSEVSGRLGLAQSIARRLITPRGSLFYDRNYGTDIRRYINAAAPAVAQVAFEIESEALKDERVESARADVTFENGKISIDLELSDGDGPFSLTIEVTALTAELVNFDIAA